MSSDFQPEELTREALGQRYPIEVVPYDPAWIAAYDAEVQCLEALFAPGVLLRLEHFGSTAVPGLAAKPVIDLLVEIRSFSDATARVVPVLTGNSYHYIWRVDCSPPHMMFVKGYGRDGYDPEVQRVHLHLAPANHPLWERLEFRDLLRERPEAARAYEALKYELAERYPHDREAYTEGKTALIAQLLECGRDHDGPNRTRRNV